MHKAIGHEIPILGRAILGSWGGEGVSGTQLNVGNTFPLRFTAKSQPLICVPMDLFYEFPDLGNQGSNGFKTEACVPGGVRPRLVIPGRQKQARFSRPDTLETS